MSKHSYNKKLKSKKLKFTLKMAIIKQNIFIKILKLKIKNCYYMNYTIKKRNKYGNSCCFDGPSGCP